MAGAKKTLNPLTEKPTTKTEVTKPFMKAYMREVASQEDREWFKTIVSNPDNQKVYTNQLDGSKYTDIDIPKVRKAFINKFYPQINAKKEKNKSFIDSIMEL